MVLATVQPAAKQNILPANTHSQCDISLDGRGTSWLCDYDPQILLTMHERNYRVHTPY